ncbi:MAG: hypothetical protein JNK42_03645 [Caedimonas sp.]|nr:hypothetical protein [Caedimonas sp.]
MSLFFSLKESLLRVIESVPFPQIYKIVFFTLLPLSVFAPLGITALMCLLAVVFFMEMARNFPLKYIFQENNKLVFLLGIILIFSFFSCFGSIIKGESFKNWVRIASLFLAGYVVLRGLQTTSCQKEIIKSLRAGFIVALILLFIESMTDGFILILIKQEIVELFKYNKSVSVMILLAGPVFFLSTRYLAPSHLFYFLSAPVFIVLIYVVFSLKHDASKVAVIIGSISFVILYFLSLKSRKIFLQILICFCFAGSLTIPKIYSVPIVKESAFQYCKKLSLYHRVAIWTTVRQIAFNQVKDLEGSVKHTLFGFGIESLKSDIFSRLTYTWELPSPIESSKTSPKQSEIRKMMVESMNLKHIKEALDPDKASSDQILYKYNFPFVTSKGIPSHPHNFILHILLDLGLVGLLFLFLLIELCVCGILRFNSHPVYLCMASGTLIIFLIIASISYGIWQSWWICVIWLVASLLQLLKVKPEKSQQEEIRISDENDLKFDFVL